MSSREAAQPRIPVVLVTGFLGSGKTTLVNRLLKTQSFSKAAVVVNEYGEVSIDHVLVEAPRYRMRMVDAGCLCGHVHEEIAASLVDLYVKRERNPDLDFDIVLIEMSGLADPVPVIQILMTDRHITEVYELKTVIAVADGVHGVGHLAAHPESVKQAAVADTLVLSKHDIAEEGALDALAAELNAINPGARQLRVANGDVDPARVLTQTGFSVGERSEAARGWLSDAHYAATIQPASADPSLSTFSLTYEGEITLPGFVLWMNLLAGFRGAGLLRVKGIVNVEGNPYAVQAVQTIISEPVPLDAWPEGDDRRSRLVFITRGIDVEDMRRTFATFRFEGGRAKRNMTIDPETYARFRDTVELFRRSPSREAANVNDSFKRELETR
ncbi:MAG TPA: GTP-binding protein [Pseudolabrys sp.]|nr:GTP-binding protein [Pseudolabrys sp.]